MRTLAICRNPERQSAGFTLIEILLVLVLMALIGGLVVPRMGKLYQSLLVRDQRDHLLAQIERLPYLAAQTGRVYRLAGPGRAGADALEGTEGWRLESSKAILVRANGLCSGGSLVLRHENGLSWRYELAAPFCRPREVSDVAE